MGNRKIGLYFGSFNPMHNGHTEVVEKALEYLDTIIICVTPNNPFKKSDSLWPIELRVNIVKDYIDTNRERFSGRVIVSDFERYLETPNRTKNSLDIISDRYPGTDLVLIMGTDSINDLHTWYMGSDITNNYKILHVKRKGFELDETTEDYQIIGEVIIKSNMSSTKLREYIRGNKRKEIFKNIAPAGLKPIKRYIRGEFNSFIDDSMILKPVRYRKRYNTGFGDIMVGKAKRNASLIYVIFVVLIFILAKLFF